jgi:hypothetical protein
MNELPLSTAMLANGDAGESRRPPQPTSHPTVLPPAHEARPALRAAPRLSIECAGIGGALGGTFGVVAAALWSIGSVMVPSFDLVVAGPLAAAVMGALIGGATGALTGVFCERRARRGSAPPAAMR